MIVHKCRVCDEEGTRFVEGTNTNNSDFYCEPHAKDFEREMQTAFDGIYKTLNRKGRRDYKRKAAKMEGFGKKLW